MLKSGSSLLKRLTVDLNKSLGIRLVDTSGREFIDLHSNIASLPLGFNHPDLVRLISKPTIQQQAIHRQAVNLYPTATHEQQLLKTFPRISPFPGAYLHLASSGSEAVETAIKFGTRNQKRPGAVLSFEGGFHGRTTGALSLTSTHPDHTRGFPQIETYKADFPLSQEEEGDSLDAVENFFTRVPHISCVIVEPVQAEGGDRRASPGFFRSLRNMCLQHSKTFIVDEVQTALGTGRIWAHEHWKLDHPPDIVTFSKKIQASGLFIKGSMTPTPDEAYAYNSTWAGCSFRNAMLETILDVIERDDLLDKSVSVGNHLFSGISTLPKVKNVRNIGSFGAFDIDYVDYYIKALQDKGLLVSKCGSSSIRIRPALVLEEKDADNALEILSDVIR